MLLVVPGYNYTRGMGTMDWKNKDYNGAQLEIL